MPWALAAGELRVTWDALADITAEVLNSQVNALIGRARGFRTATALMDMILFVHGGIRPGSPYA